MGFRVHFLGLAMGAGVAVLAAGALGAGGAAAPAQPTHVADPRAPIEFDRDIRPMLARRCLMCHGEEKQKASLRLDSFEGMRLGGDSGEPAVVPGNAAASMLYRVIAGKHQEISMPPKGDPLSAEQVRAIESWIDAGAWNVGGAGGDAEANAGGHWHWAYRARPSVRPVISAVGNGAWVRNPIDAFVLAKLESMGMKPSAEAGRETLIRRLSVDLTGLPPTVEDVDAFLGDSSREAYEKVVDRLLASPHYAERWAMVWLDLARYADSHGYEKDGLRVMWPWRDWVIDAFNRDMPFDQFTIEQLAGDELGVRGAADGDGDTLGEGARAAIGNGPTLRQMVATGFHRNTPINEEGGTDPEEFRVEAVLDRANTTAAVWLGSTFACAQCHDHKFDPVSQKEYFRFYAYFNQDEDDVEITSPTEKRAAGPTVPVSRWEEIDACERLWDEARALKTRLAPPSREAGDGQVEWEAHARASADGPASQGHWAMLEPTTVSAVRGDGAPADVAFSRAGDGSLVASGENPGKAEYVLEAPWPEALAGKPITGIWLEVMPDESTATKFAGRSANGNWVVSAVGVSRVGKRDAVDEGAEEKHEDEVAAVLASASADYWRDSTDSEKDWPATLAIDGHDDGRGWATHPRFDQPHGMVVRFAEPLAHVEGARLRVRIGQRWGDKHTIARFRVSATSDAAVAMPVPAHIQRIVAIGEAERTPLQRRVLAAHYRGISRLFDGDRRRLEEVEAALASLASSGGGKAMVMGANHTVRETHVFNRGNFLDPGEAVEPGVPAVLASVCGEPALPTRLGLARWLVDPKNPLTARVHVNRLWSRIFGRGLVETEEDFGTQGEAPTHPELLDYLASEFVSGGWSQKRLLKAIVLSATYRQSSVVDADALERDPSNKWLARGSRYRLDAELVRDQALAASGLLSRKMYGPSVFPPQPEGIWTQIYSGEKWAESTGVDRYRRGLYTFIRRTSPFPAFAGMDAPSREVVCTRRARTNTPLQALTMMNDPQVVEAAGALAAAMIRAGGSDRARVEHGWRRCVARRPTEAEVERVMRLVDQERGHFRGDASAALELARACRADRTGIEDAELAAWTMAASVLLNLDEFVTRE